MRDTIVALMMLKDENRYILNEDGSRPKYTMLEQNLLSLSELVDEIYIVDNGSKDNSQNVYDKYAKKGLIKFIHNNNADLPFDDVRDRKILLDVAAHRRAQWVLVVDGDEIYEDGAKKFLDDYCDNHDWQGKHSVSFNYVNFWRGRKKYRVDAWNNSWFHRLFAAHNLQLTGTPLHGYHFGYNYSDGFGLRNDFKSNIKVLHYGWADWNHRVLKTERYIQRDMELLKLNYDKVKIRYRQDLDEEGIILKDANPEWNEEFRK